MVTCLMPEDESYSVNEKCLCYHGPLIYEAKVLKITEFTEDTTTTGAIGTHYFVHYKGWKQTWDEWVPEKRLLKYNEANINIQKKLQQDAQAASVNANSTKGSKSKDTASTAVSGSVIGTRTGGRKDGRSGKRGRDEDEVRKPEMRLIVPELLKVILVDDWEAVTKNSQVVSLPRSPTVAQLLEEFERYVKKNEPSTLREPTLLIHTVVSGLRIYFDRSLGQNLLYRFERPQYAQIREKYITGQEVKIGSEPEMSEIYGAEHLLRMLVTLPQIVASSQMDAESIAIVGEYVAELMKWMEKEKDRLFQSEYDTTSNSYQNLSRA